MSRFHRVDDLEAMPAHRFFEYATRLPVYGGAVAHAARSAVAEEPELRSPSNSTFNPTADDLARMYPAEPAAGQLVPMFEHTVV